jgi:hypothetical protein
VKTRDWRGFGGGGASRDRTDDLIVANDEGSGCIGLQWNHLIFAGPNQGPNRNQNRPAAESLPQQLFDVGVCMHVKQREWRGLAVSTCRAMRVIRPIRILQANCGSHRANSPRSSVGKFQEWQSGFDVQITEACDEWSSGVYVLLGRWAFQQKLIICIELTNRKSDCPPSPSQGVAMKDAYEVLQHKEADLARVRNEVESARIVASMLDELPLNDPFEILQHKEADLARVRREIESLQIVAPLLSEESPSDEVIKKPPGSADEKLDSSQRSESTGTDGLFYSVFASRRPRFWGILRRKT